MNAYKTQEQSSPASGGWQPQSRPHPAPTTSANTPRRRLITTLLRSSRRARLVFALALVLLCVLAVPILALALAPKPAEALAATRDLPPGTVLTAGDLTQVKATGPSAAMIPASEETALIGQGLRIEVPAGALLDQGDIGSFPPSGTSVVPVSVKPGQYPADLQPGQQVAVFPAASTTGTQAVAAHAAASATVVQVAGVPEDSAGTVVIDLEVPLSAAPAVAQASSVVLVGLDAAGDMP